MTYEMFKEIVIQEIKGYLPPDWQGVEVQRIQCQKNNYISDALVFDRKEVDGVNLSPNIHMQGWYESYLEGYTMEEILSDIAGSLIEAEKNAEPLKAMLKERDMDDIIKENVCLKLINTMQNKKLLMHVPHKEFNDLSIICTWVTQIGDTISTANITNNLLEAMEISEDKLFELAKENTKRILQPVVMSMDEVIKKQFGIDMDLLSEEPSMMYVLSNEKGHFGATTVLFADEVDKVAQRAGEDLYLIPSSIHEFLAIPQSVMNLDKIMSMVYDINMESLELGERLSNEVYRYDRISRQVTLATDCENKSLSDKEHSPTHAMSVAEMSR